MLTKYTWQRLTELQSAPNRNKRIQFSACKKSLISELWRNIN